MAVMTGTRRSGLKRRKHKDQPESMAAAAVLDFPQAGEVITGPYYTFRIGTPEGSEGVEVAVDRGPWHACRRSAGYWWYDWSGYASGDHELVARGRTPDGEELRSEVRKFQVALEEIEEAQDTK